MTAQPLAPVRRLAVMTSGGDAPGMNSCIRAVVRYARHHGIETSGVCWGYEGLMDGKIVPLGARDVGGKLQEGGTLLKSARLPSFREPEVQARGVEILRRHGIDALAVIGGDGSLAGAAALSSHGFATIGIPASIDNDIAGTELAIGVDTALNTILEAIDRLRDTASSHGRVLIVETMGRDCGYLALMSGLTGGAEVIHVPEQRLELEEILAAVERGRARGKTHVLVTVAEGAEHKADAISEYIAARHEGYQPRVTILGHVQRGGRPTHFDRLLATRMGVRAVDTLMGGENGVMVGLQGGAMITVPLPEVVSGNRAATVDDYRLARILAQ
ncbi:MAG TPA: 6-phosphofructokinase [Gammaproteobacteria bacterium]|nr:6-phosphofructokinase [Gammaproteobacteria bacterium]